MNSQKRKIVGFVLVLALLMQSVVPAFAAEYDSTKFLTENGSVEISGKQVTPQDYGDMNGDGTFYYVAVGDSVTAGMGTKDVENIDQPLVKDSQFMRMFGGIGMFAVENYKNCAKDSYPYLVAQQLFEALTKSGFMSEDATFGYDVHDDVTGHDFGFSNMGLAAYEINDVSDLLITPSGTAHLFEGFESMHEDMEALNKAAKDDGLKGLYELYDEITGKTFDITNYPNLNNIYTTYFGNNMPLFIETVEQFIEFFVHDQLMDELTKADVISLNLGSNDLLTQFLMASFWDDGNPGSISSQKAQRISNNRIIKKAFRSLINLVSTNPGQEFDIVDTLMEAISEAELSDILDLLTILDSENIRKELEVYATNVITGYERFVNLMRKGSPENGVGPINRTAKIVFVGTLNPFGTDLNLGIFDEDQEWTGETMLCNLPGILNRLFDELKEAVKDKALAEIFTMQPAGEIDIAALAAGVPAAMAASVAMGLSGDIAAVIEKLISDGAINSNPLLYFDDAVTWAAMASKLIGIVNTWSEEEKANFINLIESLKFAETETASLAAIAQVFVSSAEAIFVGDEFSEYISGLETYAYFMALSLVFGDADSAEIIDELQGLIDVITSGGIGFAKEIYHDFWQAAKNARNEVLASKAATILEHIEAISASALNSQASFAALRAEVIDFAEAIKAQGDNNFWKGVAKSLERDFGELYHDFMLVSYNVILTEGQNGLEFVKTTARNLYEAIKPYLDEYTQFVDNFDKLGIVDYSDYSTDPAIIITAPAIYFGKGYDNKDLSEELPEIVLTLDEFIRFFEDEDHYFTPEDIYDLLNSVDDIAETVPQASAQFEVLKSAWTEFVNAWEEFNATAQAVYNNVSDEAIALENYLINHYRAAFNQYGFISVWNQMSNEARTAFNRLMVHEFINAVEFAEDFTSDASLVLDELPDFPHDAFWDWTNWLLSNSRGEAEEVIEEAISSIAISFDEGTVKAVVNEIYETLKIVNDNIIDGTSVGAFTAIRALDAVDEFRPIVDKFIDWSKEAVSTTAVFISEGGISPAAARIASLRAMTREDLTKIAAECAELAMKDVIQYMKDVFRTSPQAISEAFTTSALKDVFTKALVTELIKSDLVSGTAVIMLQALHDIDWNLPSIDPIVASLEAFGTSLTGPYYTAVVDVISATAFKYIGLYDEKVDKFNELYTSVAALLSGVTTDKAVEIENELAEFTDNIDSGMKGVVLREFANIVVNFINDHKIPEIIKNSASNAWNANYQRELDALVNLAQAVENYIDVNGFYTLIPALENAIGKSFDLGGAVLGMYNALKETVGVVVERGSTAARLTKTFADAGELLVDSVKTVKDTLDKGIGDLLGDSKSWTKFISAISKDPVTLAKVVACLLTDEDVKASASAFLQTENLSFPLIYLIFGNTASKPIQEMNSRLDKLAKEFRRKGDDVEYVDIYDIINESNFDPHPETANHRIIADKIAAAVLDDISINPKRMTLTIKNDFGRVLATGTIETFNCKAIVEAKAAKDCVIESVKLNGGKNLNTGLFASDKSYKDTITYKNGDELVVTFKNTKAELEYTVTLNPDGGVLADGNEIVGVAGTELPIPTKDGYTFDGWFDDNEEPVEVIRAEETLHAHWTEIQETPVTPDPPVNPSPVSYGSSGPREYTVTLDPNGGNLADKEFVGLKGDEITAVPTKVGYNFLGWFTAKEGGKKVETITKSTTLYAHWELSSVDVADKYIDVNKDDWFYESVQYLTSIGAMDGIDEDEFGPLNIGTRAQVVEILYNIQGCPSVSGSVSYPDIKKGDEWYDAVLWGTQNRVVLGYGTGEFGPEDPITREQLALVLMRYTGDLGLNNSARADINGFKDYKKVADYATDAMRWAVATKLIQGNDLNQLNPGSDASRSEIAAILERYAKTILGK